ncbi:MAG: DNA replication and repair protein RecF [Myxococcaceae bacterium]|nr:DNA replication and repair protein RecF [Myxococcaceae bacterium]
MRLLRLRYSDFRNLADVELAPSEHATIAVGQNGQGKTNLLEGLFFLVTLKPLRASRLQELVRFGAERARVAGTFLLGGAEREIAVEVSGGLRQAYVDGKRASSLEEYFGGVAVVAFTPDDLDVVKGGPEGRRQFLDRAVFNRFPAYLRESRAYGRALKGRNRLLKDHVAPDYLESWDVTLSQTGARLWTRRRALLTELAPRAVAAFAAIGRTVDPAAYTYAPAHLDDVDFQSAAEPALARALHEALVRRRARDLERGFTSVGPHADDLEIRLGERLARTYASQGQQRALILGWKIAEIENLHAALGFLPLLLLDDVSSELDPERNAYLMDYLAASGAQTFLTTTDAALVEKAASADTVWYRVVGGTCTVEARGEGPASG